MARCVTFRSPLNSFYSRCPIPRWGDEINWRMAGLKSVYDLKTTPLREDRPIFKTPLAFVVNRSSFFESLPVPIFLCADVKLGTSSDPVVSVTQSLPPEDQPRPEASQVDWECNLWGQRIMRKRWDDCYDMLGTTKVGKGFMQGNASKDNCSGSIEKVKEG